MTEAPINSLAHLGSFPGVVQVVPTLAHVHELVSGPLRPGLAGGGDLINHGGPTIRGGRVFNIYIAPVSINTTDFDAFTKALCATYYLSPDQTDRAPSIFVGSAIPSLPLPLVTRDYEIMAWLDRNVRTINSNHTADTYYSIVMPMGSTVYLGSDASCSSFCGFHEKTPGGVYFGVIDDSTCTGCHGSFTPAQGRMMIHAHEYAEWRSDPDGNAWYDNLGWENADKCAWQGVSWGPWFVQPYWVNGRGAYYGPYVPVPVPQPPPPPPPVAGKTLVSANSIFHFSDGTTVNRSTYP